MKIVDHSRAAHFVAAHIGGSKKRPTYQMLIARTPAALDRLLASNPKRSLCSLFAVEPDGTAHPVVLERVGRAIKATTWRLV